MVKSMPITALLRVVNTKVSSSNQVSSTTTRTRPQVHFYNLKTTKVLDDDKNLPTPYFPLFKNNIVLEKTSP
jgi:hypothetical protein